MKKILRFIMAVSILGLANSCKKEAPGSEESSLNPLQSARPSSGPGTVSVFSTGFNNPRSLDFGPDGNLYVAEAGIGGTSLTTAICPQLQVAFPFGPYTGSVTGGRISRVSPTGVRTTVTSSLPSSLSNPILNDIMGVGDVAFIGNQIYALMAGAGCSHGVASVPNGILKITSSTTHSVIADLGTWSATHPVAEAFPGDYEPEGVWYSMETVRGEFYALEPNHGELVKVGSNGAISRVIDFSAHYGHIVPTALAYRGNFFVGNLGTFPIVDGSANIYKVSPDGEPEVWRTGFTTILGLVIDQNSRMYVLENTVGSVSGFPEPGKGRVVRVDANGEKTVVATGLSLPTGLAMGPDGNLYVSNWGFGRPPGGGEILKITL